MSAANFSALLEEGYYRSNALRRWGAMRVVSVPVSSLQNPSFPHVSVRFSPSFLHLFVKMSIDFHDFPFNFLRCPSIFLCFPRIGLSGTSPRPLATTPWLAMRSLGRSHRQASQCLLGRFGMRRPRFQAPKCPWADCDSNDMQFLIIFHDI